ncbi:MAG: 50S ribosomal protein L11 methyltransferase [Anaerolineales bacterium]|jgi:ribosomal protein L11 methyltransferase
MNWLEVSLTVNGELAEAVADVLARFAPNGVVTESEVEFLDDEDEGTPFGEVTVCAYLAADAALEETRQKLEESLFYLGTIQPLPVPRFTLIADQNWMEAWKTHYRPIPVGRKLIIVPAWLESPDAKRIPIRIDPGMAFGTGTHPSTQLCLELLETWTPQGGEVIDLGCGSGILSIAALKLGAGTALGVDIDATAVKASRENALANGIPAEQFVLGLGSVTAILEGQFSIRRARLVVANILAPVILRLIDAGMADLLAPGGALILAGILSEQAEAVRSAAVGRELDFLEQRQMGDWVALVFKDERRLI